MTLIELALVLVLLLAFALVTVRQLKPERHLNQLHLLLAQHQDLVMAARAYHRHHGAWPAEHDRCASAVEVLQDGTSPWLSGVSRLANQVIFSCAPGNIADPLLMTYTIAVEHLGYVQRYLYDLEVLDDPTAHAVVRVRTRVPPSEQDRQVIFKSVPLGRAPLSNHQDLNGQGFELEPTQAFIERPTECDQAQNFEIAVQPSTFCSAVALTGQGYQLWRFPFSVTVVYRRRSEEDSSSNAPNLVETQVQAWLTVERSLSLDRIEHDLVPCEWHGGTLECDHHVAAVDGWLAETNLQIEPTWILNYGLGVDISEAMIQREINGSLPQNGSVIAPFFPRSVQRDYHREVADFLNLSEIEARSMELRFAWPDIPSSVHTYSSEQNVLRCGDGFSLGHWLIQPKMNAVIRCSR